AEDRPGTARRLDLPLLGREDELSELQQAFRRVQKESRCELLTVFADAGTGKTRLAEEFVGRLNGGTSVLQGRCLAYGSGGALRPLEQALERAAQVAPEDARDEARGKLRALLSTQAAREEIEPLLSAFGL